MIITTEVTEQDYRAQQWSVLVDRAKLPTGVIVCLPLAAVLFWLSMGKDESVALTLRVFAFILAGVGFLLVAIMGGFRLTQKRPLGDKDVPLGPHTYEITEKAIAVSSEHRRGEFPVSALQSVVETPSHFFVVLRQGADLIIPKRGLDSAQTQAVQTLREAVAFSSLHIDSLSSDAPETIARSITSLRWISAILVAVLPFTFGSGFIGFRGILWAAVTGAILLGGMLLWWRTRKGGWTSVLFLVPMIMLHLSGVKEQSAPGIHAYQFFILSFIAAGLPVLLFPQWFRRIARIPESREGFRAQG